MGGLRLCERCLPPKVRLPAARCHLRKADECGLATAAELMYFFGAPLAHVVAYCEHLRLENINRRNMEMSRRIARQRPSASRSIFCGWDS